MMPVPADHLIVFTRYPEPGKTKTRLMGALGAEGAAQLQRRMTENLMAWIRQFAAQRTVSVEIRFAGGSAEQIRAWLGPDFTYRPQETGNLGRRMRLALRTGRQEGACRTVLVGTDVPGLTAAVLHRAFDLLHQCPLVFGPATDGGYYLVGMDPSANHIRGDLLFEDIPWSSETVLADTLKRARTAGLDWQLIDRLGDVDYPRDLKRWQDRPRRASHSPSCPLISVIIPTLNEAANLPRTVAGVRSDLPVEIIVADGGSGDGTSALAFSMGLKTVVTKPSRALQMNLGAKTSEGSILLFLHADTLLPPDWQKPVRSVFKETKVGVAAFRLAIDAPGGGMRLVEKLANWRSRFLRMPYGDQALVASRTVFAATGGYRPVPIMEDFDFVRRARCHGRVMILPAAVKTSARRWQRLGVFKTTLINQMVVGGFYLGISRSRLARLYRNTG